MLAASDPTWYLLVAPLSVAVAIGGLWFSQKGERRAQADERRAQGDRDKAQTERDVKMHSAMFGYQEGATSVPGMWNIVVGDPHNGVESLGTVAREARATATTIAEKQESMEGEVGAIKDMATAAAELAADARASVDARGPLIEQIAEFGQGNADKLGHIEEKVGQAAALARDAAEKASAAAVNTDEALDLITTHIADDQAIHDDQRVALTAIGGKVGARVRLNKKVPSAAKAPTKKQPRKKS